MIVDELIAILGYDVKGDEELKRFNRGLDNAERKAQAVANRINAMSVAIGAFIGTIAAQGAMRLGSMIGSLPGDVLAVGREFENLETVLTTIEGSSDKAREAMDWVEQFAKTTPYDLNQVSEAFVRMRAYGLDPMSGQLKAVGDAAAGMGKTLMQGVEAIADAVTGENERLKEFGITTKVAGDQITYNWNEDGKAMSKTVRKNGQDITAALLEIFGRFDGAMDGLSKTQEGVIANLGDEWTGFLKRIAEKGYYDDVTRRLNGLKGNIEQWDRDGTLDRAAQAISGFLTGSIELGVHIGRQLFAVGQGAYQAASGITELISRVTGLNSVASAGVLGAAVLGSSAMGRGMMMALARRMPALAGLLAVDELITGLRGGDTYIGQLEGGQAAIDGLREKFASLAEAIESVADAAALEIDWSQFETPSDFLNTEIVRFVEDLNKLVAELTAVFNAIANGITTVREAINNPLAAVDQVLGLDGPGAVTQPALSYMTTSRAAPKAGRPGGMSVDDRIAAAFANAQGNLAKMQSGAPVEAVANDNRVDNRNQSVNPSITIHQTVQQVTNAPAAAASATGRAVAGAVTAPARLITGNAR